MDDYSRYLIAWRLSPTTAAPDVMATLDEALHGLESRVCGSDTGSVYSATIGLRLQGAAAGCGISCNPSNRTLLGPDAMLNEVWSS